MLKNFWYVVSPSSQLTNDLKAVRIVGQSFVAFRETMVKRVCFLTCACIEGGGALRWQKGWRARSVSLSWIAFWC